ncbi:MAG: signal peptide peptidase SppA [Bacteroidales bacterium]|nr:signal peptide peptidase SppA [Bacteroidales bacterium]
MNNFVKTTLAVVCGLILVWILSAIIGIGLLGSLIAGSSGKPVLPKSGVLKIDMSKIVITEQSEDNFDFASLATTGGDVSTRNIGLWEALRALDQAAKDPAVQFIYLKTDGNTTSLAALSEFRQGLCKFRKDGEKAIVSYVENPGTGSYYLSSVADKIYMTPHTGANYMLNGISSSLMFYGDILKRLGINVQLIRHGKFKSAGETFTRGDISPENREQMQVLVNSIWQTVAGEIAESRHITTEALNETIDGLQLCLPQDFIDCGLADELLDRSALARKLADLSGVDDYEDVDMIDFGDYLDAKETKSRRSKKIAVLYANGEIVDGSDGTQVAGDRFAALIEDIRQDEDVEAVVLRVNSPGGSVLASEKIRQQIDLLEIPLIASYGDYAASGGYWISSGCDKIYTDAVTLTGSIGVFSMIPEFSKLAQDKLHIGVESICSNKHGDMFSLMRPFDSAEQAALSRSIEEVYDRFTSLVAAKRPLSKEEVDNLGQGRVWTGADAVANGLADEIGTLEDAIRYAAAAAGDEDLSNWKIQAYPEPQTIAEQLLGQLGQGQEDDYSILLGKYYKDIRSPQMLARMPYTLKFQ